MQQLKDKCKVVSRLFFSPLFLFIHLSSFDRLIVRDAEALVQERYQEEAPDRLPFSLLPFSFFLSFLKESRAILSDHGIRRTPGGGPGLPLFFFFFFFGLLFTGRDSRGRGFLLGAAGKGSSRVFFPPFLLSSFSPPYGRVQSRRIYTLLRR